MMTDRGDHFATYKNIKSLCCISETNVSIIKRIQVITSF